jgi:hypothetical protein
MQERQSARNETISQSRYTTRTPDHYLQTITSDQLAGFSPEQLQIVRSLLESAIPKPAPKIVDLRFGVDLLISRFYIVLFVGKDRRRQRRTYFPELVLKWGNKLAAVLLLVGVNLVISLVVLMFAYLVKSVLGIDLTPGHLADQVKRF